MAGLNFDPFGKSDPFSGLDFDGKGAARRPQRPEYRRPLDDEDFRSVGRKAIDAGTSGVGHVLGVLDKPGQAARGLLAGKGVGSLKHLVPFSDTLGITTEADHTSGRDLTDKAGLTRKGDKGWGAWGAGLAADIATDPLTYTTFGAKHALTPIGKAVEKTGALKGFTGRQMLEGFHGVEPVISGSTHASDVAHAIDQGKKIATGRAAATGVEAGQPLSSLVRVGLPFGGPGVNVGTGQAAQRFAGKLDSAGDFLKYGNPVGRAVGSLFDSKVHGAVDKITQQGAAKYLDPSLHALKEQARYDRNDLIGHLDPLVGKFPKAETLISDATRSVAEGVPFHFDKPLERRVAKAATHVNAVGKRQIEEAQAAGAPIRDVADQYVNYVHRSAFPENPATLQLGGKGGRPQPFLPNTSGANIGRDKVFRDIPGGTYRINDWFRRFAGDKSTGSKGLIASAVHGDLLNDLQEGGNLLTYTPALAKKFDAKASAVATRVRNANPAYRNQPATAATAAVKGSPFFSPDLVSDVTQRGQQHARTVAHANAAVGILADNARRLAPGNPEALVPLHQAMKKLGLQTYAADAAAGKPMEGALVQVYKGLARQGAGKVDPFLMGNVRPLRDRVNQFGITQEHLDQLTKAYAGWKSPEPIKSPLGALDSVTNAFKALAYPIWVPSHVRNAGTALVNNARHGVGWQDYAAQLQAMTGRGTRDLSAIHPSLAGLNPAQQADKLRRMQYGSANIFGGNGMNEEITGNIKEAFQKGQRYTPNVPGSDRAGTTGGLIGDTADLALKRGLLGSLTATGKALTGGAKGLFDPTRRWGQSVGENLAIKGVGGAAKDTLPGVAAGRKIGTNVEDFFRGALFNKLAREGHAPGQAADVINKLHFDYDALTGFEKNVMRRFMPFYTYARKNLPLQVDTALHNPGVLQAQSKPFTQQGPEGKGYVPTYLNSGYAVPIGDEADGHRQYVSKLGLPAEEAFEKLHFRNGLPDVRRTALAQLGGMNPVIKAPLEQLFNTQFHTQRQLTDLHAPRAASAIGRLWNDDNPQILSQILSNSPLTRFVSSADKLTDPRKSWAQKAVNLATGVKVTDVDTDKQRAIDVRQALDDIMKTHPNLSRYSSFYVKPEDAQDLTPEEVELMRAYSTQQAAAKAFAKAQRIGIQP